MKILSWNHRNYILINRDSRKRFMNKIIKQAKGLGISLKPIVNTRQHQRLDTECGVYSLYFIISRLEGKSCEFINNKIIRDKEMNSYRKKFFRPNNILLNFQLYANIYSYNVYLLTFYLYIVF